MTDEQRAAVDDFMQALGQRAEEQGIDLGRRGNGGPRNGAARVDARPVEKPKP